MGDEGGSPESFILHPSSFLVMAYVSLYRKYRSQSFGEVIGQAHVTTVLQNAIRMGRIAHAYLFCGPRGCGKTSTARLLARALNCVGADGSADSPSAEPCGVCPLCTAIREGSAMDVIEMDAASETGIDDVREKIIENAKFAPGEARYKVYIIDEVHDLSLKAFDSLLKTIEEPPAHVVFILATTEAHKVPITVRSRCQRMDFRRGVLQDLVDNIERVLDQEGIAYEPEAITAVARAAEGSFRDSLSLLEQALAYTDGEKLTAEAVHASIGTVGPQLLDDVTRTIAGNDMYGAFLKASELAESGKDVKQTLIALQSHLRDLLVAGLTDGPQALADVSAERFVQLKEQSALFTSPQLLKMLDVLAESERSLRLSNQHQRILEVALWNILPRHIEAPLSSPSSTPARAEPSTRAPQSLPSPQQPQQQQQPRNSAPEAAAESTPQRPRSDPAAPAASAAEESEEPDQRGAAPADVTPWGAEIDLDGIRRIWPRVVKRVLQRSRSAAAYFGKEEVERLEKHVLYVAFPNEFARSGADKPKGRELVESVLAEELGITGWKVRCILQKDDPVEKAASVPDHAAPLDVLGLADGAADPDFTRDSRAASNGAMEQAIVALPAPEAVTANDGEDFLKLVLDEFDGRIVED